MSTVSTPQRYLINVEQFEKMGAAGIFPPEARIELIEGELLTMAPIDVPHMWAVSALTRALLASPLGERVFLFPQQPVILSDLSEPQPDIALARGPADRYRKVKARPADLVLLIEVSDSTLAFDRRRKGPLYARCGVMEYWIVNVNARRLEVFRDPVGGEYAHTAVLEPGTPVRLAAFPDIEFDWSIALP
jgi:Uma2 family endonuclease